MTPPPGEAQQRSIQEPGTGPSVRGCPGSIPAPATHPCPVCAHPWGIALSAIARDGAALTTIMCAGCGIARTDPMPSETELAEYYASEYRLDYKGVLTPKRKHVLRAGWLARQRLAVLLPQVAPGARVLDLGAGGGEFVALARAAGLEAEGIEPNAGYASYAAEVLGLPVRQGRWQDAEIGAGQFAAVTLFHVLEHLPDPMGCLRQVHCWLQPGGVVFIEVPNLVAPLGTRKRRFHRAHLLHFTAGTLAATARSAGFAVLEAASPGDGGNAVVLARKSTDSQPPALEQEAPGEICAAAADILRFEQSSPVAPGLWLPHGLRFFRRITAMLREQRVILRFRDGRTLLESLQQGLV